jgi:hypothetical protein
MADQASNFTWETLNVASVRLGRCTGHLCRICPALAEEGKARFVKGGGKTPYWEIRSDVQMPDLRRAVKVEKTISLRMGSLVISVRGECGISVEKGRVTIIEAASDEFSAGDSAGIDRGLSPLRSPHKKRSKTLRTRPI